MRYENIQVFLKTMCEYSTVNINQVFTEATGQSLSVRCLNDIPTFEIQHSATAEIIHIESVEETADYILQFTASHDLSTNS